MTGRTHDLAAFTTLVGACAIHPPESVSLSTVVVALGANMLGGLFPDIDQTSSEFWRKIRFGRILARYISPLFGKHRFLSHSLIGMAGVGILLHFFLIGISGVLIVDMSVVWWGFMLGFASHLLMDTLTKEGVPYLLPISIRFGFPPFEFLRITTGKYIEKAFVFPGLILVNAYLFYLHYPVFVEILRKLV